jgi:hypothetical protein
MNSQNPVQNTVMESKPGHSFEHFKRVAFSAPGKLLLVVAVFFSLVSIPLLTRANDSNEKRTLTGNWLVTVTRVNPPPSLPPTFLSLMTCFEDGNVSEESNTTSIRSTGHGDWERTGHQQFTRSIVFFRFDATRNYLGIGRITATVTLSEDGSEFVADAVVQNYDASGNLLTTLQSTEVGHRL